VSRVAEIWRYPVKSFAGERLQRSSIVDSGLEGDRRWAFIDSDPNRAGKFFNIKQHAPLMTYAASRAHETAFVDELSSQAGRALTLRDAAGSNFDDSPVLVVNLASVAAFGLDAGVRVDHRRFRANLYLDDLEPNIEIGWQGRTLRAGNAELEVVKRCKRCEVITREPDTTEASPDLLRILTERYDTCMGVYCRVVKPGSVAVGDLVGPI
jgi:uncharacterized protein YcbX